MADTAPPLELPGPVVDAGWLATAIAGGHRPAVVDVRWYLDGRSGHDAYLAGHVPGARWLDVDADLSAPPGPGTGRHPLPDPVAFVRRLAAVGIGPATPVVAYDDAGGSVAARLWWMLQVLGRPAAVLDGGLAAWDGPLETGPAARPVPVDAGDVSGLAWPPAAVADTDGVARAVAGGTAVVLDARPASRYRGEPNAIDARLGHIPGARSAPWADNLDPATGRFLPPPDLAARYATLGVTPGREVVASCGSGVTACHDLLALRLAGLGPAGLYPGSWSAWSADPDRPVATGPEPGA